MKLFRKIKSIFTTYNKHGLDGLVYAILRNLNIKTKYISIIEKKKNYIEKKIIAATKKTVIRGNYKSTKLSCNTYWGGFDTSSKLLGFYEEQVQYKIVDLKKKYNLNYIVNFGSAEGYHIIGLIKNQHFKEGLAFEIDTVGQKRLRENLSLNEIDHKIKIFGKANFEEVGMKLDEQKLQQTLFLVDIEGEEFNLFSAPNLKNFNKSVMIIENHDFMIKNQTLVSNFFNLMNENFDLEILENGPRNPHSITEIKDLDDDERWLIMAEGRPHDMNWLIFTPKIN